MTKNVGKLTKKNKERLLSPLGDEKAISRLDEFGTKTFGNFLKFECINIECNYENFEKIAYVSINFFISIKI